VKLGGPILALAAQVEDIFVLNNYAQEECGATLEDLTSTDPQRAYDLITSAFGVGSPVVVEPTEVILHAVSMPPVEGKDRYDAFEVVRFSVQPPNLV